MSTARIIFYAIVTLLAAVGAFMLFGLVVAAIQYLVIIGLIVAGGAIVYKLMKKPDSKELSGDRAMGNLKDAMRQIEEIKRKQMSK